MKKIKRIYEKLKWDHVKITKNLIIWKILLENIIFFYIYKKSRKLGEKIYIEFSYIDLNMKKALNNNLKNFMKEKTCFINKSSKKNKKTTKN